MSQDVKGEFADFIYPLFTTTLQNEKELQVLKPCNSLFINLLRLRFKMGLNQRPPD